LLFEEVGFFDNLEETYAACVETQRDGARKFGSMMFIGTGGDMAGGGTLAAQKIFFNPETYDCLEFPDLYEWRSSPIGYFVPAYLGLNEFKDENGFTDVEVARGFLEAHRTKLKKAKNASVALDAEIINRPLTPSEMFLSASGNIFPTAEVRARLDQIDIADSLNLMEKRVTLFFNPEAKDTNGVDYKIDVTNELKPINSFPIKNTDNREGCVVVYEFPQVIDGKVPPGAYIIGHDPYASDDASGSSLGTIFVLKTEKYASTIGSAELVAVYRGRPYAGRHIVNDILHKLSLFYGNAKIYFENVRGNVKEYFEKIKRLDLLCKQPTTIFNKKASFMTGPSVTYGYPMSSRVMKMEGIQYIRDWLLEVKFERDDRTYRNIDFI